MLGDLGKFIVAKGFKQLPKVQKLPDLVTLRTITTYSMNVHILKPTKLIGVVFVSFTIAKIFMLTFPKIILRPFLSKNVKIVHFNPPTLPH